MGANVRRRSGRADTAGNTVLVYKEGKPYFMVGSHVDSVFNGGRYDGVIGVLAALEVAAVTAGKLEHGLRVVIFSAEEARGSGPRASARASRPAS